MFEPAALAPGPSGFFDLPRPFVFRATHLDGRTVAPGDSFWFDLNLFDLHSPAIRYLVLALTQLAHTGLGPGRGRAQLVEASHRGRRIFDGQSLIDTPTEPLELRLHPLPYRIDRVRVRFVTPTELKGGDELAARPEFGTLAARVRDRVSKLGELYGSGPLEIDFRAFGERAAQIRMTRCELKHVDVERRSSRTGRVHPLGGFVGEAEYEGDLAEFVPYLHAAKWTGVGRQTVWGKGQIEIEELGPVTK